VTKYMSSIEEIGLEEHLEKQTALLKNLAEQLIVEIKKDCISPEAVQSLLTLGVKLYFKKVEDGEHFPPFKKDQQVIASEVLTTVTEMMEQVDLEVFELGLWQSWTKS
jgi:hypothetical protein